MTRRTLVQASTLALAAAACTGVSSNNNRPLPQRGDGSQVTVVPAEHHDVSPPLREIPPTPRPPDDMKHEVPIHRLPVPPSQ